MGKQCEEYAMIATVDVQPVAIAVIGEPFPVPKDVSTGDFFMANPCGVVIICT
jgi:hypothetical protein